MNFLAILFTVLSVATICFSLTKPKYGALCYLIYMYLAPYLYIGGHIIYARVAALMFVFFLIFKLSTSLTWNKLKPLVPYIVFLLWNLVFVFGAEHVGESFSRWTKDVSSLVFIVFLYANMCADIGAVKIYKWTLFSICLVFTLYGLFLTTIPGLNPYRLLVSPMFGTEFNEAYAAGNSGLVTSTILAEGRLFGRISSVFDHPMTYGLNLGFFFIYSLYLFKDKPKVLVCILALIIAAIITSGTRTPIGALGLTVLAIVLYMRKIKYFTFGILGFIAVFYIVSLISLDAKDYLMSIVNSDDSITQGSSLNMRIEQLQGSFDIVRNDLLLGKGYGWTQWYNSTFGGHPKARFFESIIYCVLVNTGIVGFVLWGWFVVKYYFFAKVNIEDKFLRMAVLALLFYFLIYCGITGDFNIKNMFVFFVVMVGINMENKQLALKIS